MFSGGFRAIQWSEAGRSGRGPNGSVHTWSENTGISTRHVCFGDAV